MCLGISFGWYQTGDNWRQHSPRPIYTPPARDVLGAYVFYWVHGWLVYPVKLSSYSNWRENWGVPYLLVISRFSSYQTASVPLADRGSISRTFFNHYASLSKYHRLPFCFLNALTDWLLVRWTINQASFTTDMAESIYSSLLCLGPGGCRAHIITSCHNYKRDLTPRFFP